MVDNPKVLAVDDDPEMRELISSYLSDEYEVVLAPDGAEAQRLVDQADVMLLDRKMAGMEGRDLLRAVRADGHDIPVAMVTAIEPDFDIIDMGFDDYLVKPFRREELRSTVRNLVNCVEYDDVIREYFSPFSKVASLEAEKTDAELEASDEYSYLKTRLQAVKTDARDVLNDSIEHGTFATLFARIDP